MNVSSISKNQQTFHFETGVPHFYGQFASMNVTAPMRTSNCGGLFASFQRVHVNVFISVLNFYMKVHKSQFEQKIKMLLSLSLLQLLLLLR